MTALYQKMMPFVNYSNFILFCEVKILGYKKDETSTSYCLSCTIQFWERVKARLEIYLFLL